MFFLSSIQPNKRDKRKRLAFDYITPGAIFGVWVVLIIFGILTLLQPQWLKDVGSKGREEEALSLKEQADLLLKDRKFVPAINLYAKVLSIDPEIKDAIGNIALAHRELGHYNKALNILSKLADKYPEQAHLNYLNIAEVYKKMGDKSKTAEFYLKSSEVSPEPDYASFRAASIFLELENYEKALTIVSEGIDYRMDFVSRYMGMLKRDYYTLDDKPETQAVLKSQLDKGVSEEDLLQYDKTFMLQSFSWDRDLAKAFNLKGICLFKLGRIGEAESCFNTAIKINPHLEESRQYLKMINENS